MAIRIIRTEEDPILRKTSRLVTKFDDRLGQILDDMKETMEKANGVGLAAVQVGLLRRIVVVDVGDGSGVLELINPEIVEADGEQEGQEGCLSLPDKWAIVKRPEHVRVRAQTRTGAWRMFEGEGLKARAFCHELDHLDGHLFIDRMEKMLTEEEVRRLQNERVNGKETDA
ncbi:MAG: peptide deformylase [Clostridia bacterium]|nr:peptide deformylase [Clostridia bacterium]